MSEATNVDTELRAGNAAAHRVARSLQDRNAAFKRFQQASKRNIGTRQHEWQVAGDELEKALAEYERLTKTLVNQSEAETETTKGEN